MAARERLHALDGLRGFAAVVVLFHHTLLLDPWFITALSHADGIDGGGLARRLVYYSPLHLFVAGTEAVGVFFVLSGIVLASAFSEREAIRPSYFASRLLRLYLPIAGATVLALCLSSIRPTLDASLLSSWHGQHLRAMTWADVLAHPVRLVREVAVLPGTSWLNSSLWSMRVEIAASIVLAGILLIARGRALALVATVALAYTTRHAGTTSFFLRYLPFFVGGAWLASTTWRASRRQGDALVAAGTLALTTPWIASGFGIDVRSGIVGQGWSLAGALLLAAAALGESSLSGALRGRLGQYLGTRSYSLYLVHAPLVTTIGFFVVAHTGRQPLWLPWMPVIFSTAFAVAEVFFRLVEAPAHRASRRVKLALRAAESRLGA